VSGRVHVLILLALSLALLVPFGAAAQSAERSTSERISLPLDHPVRNANDLIGLIDKAASLLRHHAVIDDAAPSLDFHQDPQSPGGYEPAHALLGFVRVLPDQMETI